LEVRDTAHILDFGTRDRLVIGNGRQHLESGTRELLDLGLLLADQETQIGCRTKRPAVAHPNQIDAAMRVAFAKPRHDGLDRNIVGEFAGNQFFRDRRAGGKHQRLSDPLSLGQRPFLQGIKRYRPVSSILARHGAVLGLPGFVIIGNGTHMAGIHRHGLLPAPRAASTGRRM
jgi:hypothetical protein